MTTETLICRAEIAYKRGRVRDAILYARRALENCAEFGQRTALRIFIARAYSKIGKFNESNTVYRALLSENIYIPPVIMGLLYNNFKTNVISTQKMSRNLGLIKIFVR